MACRKTAVSARQVALQMIHNTIVCAPDGLRLTRMQLVRTLASWRPDLTAYRDLESARRIGLKSLARRYLELHDEIADLDAIIAAIVDELALNLVARNSIGHIGAAQLLLTAGDNPERLRSEASFASLCGVSPVPASSGKTVRHRLNRGGDRAGKPRGRTARCFVPHFDGAFLSSDSKDALWDRFFMGAPQRQRRSVERYSIVKRAWGRWQGDCISKQGQEPGEVGFVPTGSLELAPE